MNSKLNAKSYLLDTSIILDDVQNIIYLYQNGQNRLFLTDTIIDELDSKKELQNEMGYFVREFFRNIHTLSESKLKTESAKLLRAQDSDFISEVVFKSENLSVPLTLIYRPHYKAQATERSHNDSKIIEIAKEYKLTLLTNDISLKIRALAQNISAQSLFRNRVENPEKIDFWHRFELHKEQDLSTLSKNAVFQKLSDWSLCEIDEVDNTDNALYYTGRKFFALKVEGKCELCDIDALLEAHKPYILPANLEQKMLYALLLHPKNFLTIATGATGSGKTLIALQAGISLLKSGAVEGIIYLRNTITATDKEAELGFRKGDETQKLSYFMYPLFSAINFMIDKLQQTSLAKKIEYRGEVKTIEKMEATEYFLQKHKIEVIDIAHARGITLSNKFIIFDEVQNASNATIKLIGTRVGEGSRIVFLGDWAQIDHPYLSRFRNGALSLLKKALENNMIAGIQLRQTIRSEVAKWFGDFE